MTTSAARRALLDTSVVIDFPAAQVAEVADEVAISAGTLAELQYGVRSRPTRSPSCTDVGGCRQSWTGSRCCRSTWPPRSTTGRWPPWCTAPVATLGLAEWICRSPRPRLATAWPCSPATAPTSPACGLRWTWSTYRSGKRVAGAVEPDGRAGGSVWLSCSGCGSWPGLLTSAPTS